MARHPRMRVFIDPIKEAWEDRVGLPALPKAPEFDHADVNARAQELWDIYDSTLMLTDGDQIAAAQASDQVRKMRRKRG